MTHWIIAALAAVAALLATSALAWDLRCDNWVATDALGRKLPGFEECGPPRPNRTVGMFYFLWLGAHGTDGPYDNTKIIAANPDNPQYGPRHAMHWWGESEAGYYLSTDPWVIRRNLCMLADAGVDVLILDATNGPVYQNEYTKLCEIATQIRARGEATPDICFITWSASPDVAKHLYDNFYSKHLYPDLWFKWKGKPLILGRRDDKLQDGSVLPDKIKDFFTWRECWFDFLDGGGFVGKHKWSWASHTPQNYGWDVEGVPEEVSVSAATHPTTNRGRSRHNDKQPPIDKYRLTPDSDKGLFFDEQWKRALELDPEFLFITGWNEWQAMRFLKGPDGDQHFLGKRLPDGETFFVDQFNAEFSRDIEPMKGGFTDNYYYQTVAGIRRYKGVRPPQQILTAPIKINGCFEEWDPVSPEYRDHIGDTTHRDHKGWGDAHYVNKTGRNDLVKMKVSTDEDTVYFYCETRAPISPRTDPMWMLLLIDADRDPSTGWFGYDYILNLSVPGDTVTLVQENLGGWKWSEGEKCEYRVKGNKMEIAVPRRALGFEGKPVRFDFKWADNIQRTDDITEFSISGDAAPARRFNYRYGE